MHSVKLDSSSELPSESPAGEIIEEIVDTAWSTHQSTHAALVRWVNLAFKHYHSILSLSRLPLANSPLIAPALVLDPVSPTADERGRAVRLLLRWATAQLAPSTERYPLDSERPLDDPTWRDPLWWRYNILRHRYLDPLHPDEFVDGGRYTETILALTGIPSADSFFQERNRAVREIAERLHQQLGDGAGNRALQQMALDETYRPLRAHPTALALLGIASTFDEVFPRALLLSLAAEEHLTAAESALGYLTTQRFLLTGDEGASLWISPVLRTYVHSHQASREQQRRHRHVARYYEEQGEALSAAEHRQLAGEWPRAAEILLAGSETLVNELQFDELRDALGKFRREQLVSAQWREIQIVLADLWARAGQREEALHACRRALQDAEDPPDQARIYRRMGKLYEMHNQMHALTYYQQAAERFTDSEPEFVQMLKDRAWLYIIRKEWDKAERDLNLALNQVTTDDVDARADIYDALAGLNRYQHRYDLALEQAQRALTLREESGDLLRIAKGLGNLGLLYQAMHDYAHAIAAHQEAMTVYQRLGNQELTSTALLNIGMAFHLDNHLPSAVQYYQQCLTLCQEIGYPLVEVKARSNLAEAYAQLDQPVAARRHWQAGYALSLEAGFEDQTKYFVHLTETIPALADLVEGSVSGEVTTFVPALAALPAESQSALLIAEQRGQVTPRTLMDETGVSKATATRRLTELVESGYLTRVGQGRGTYYVLSGVLPSTERVTASPVHAVDDAHTVDAHTVDDAHTIDAMMQTLHHELDYLQQTYAVTHIALEQTQVTRMTIQVHFRQEPTLRQYIDMQQYLTQTLNCPIHLEAILS